jgi:hypothetical protein
MISKCKMKVLRILFELASTNFGNISLMAYNCLRKNSIQTCPALPSTPGIHKVFSLYSNFQLSRCRNDEKIGSRRTDGRKDIGTISNKHIFLKTCSNKQEIQEKRCLLVSHSDVPPEVSDF